jgi:hypothetical protein
LFQGNEFIFYKTLKEKSYYRCSKFKTGKCLATICIQTGDEKMEKMSNHSRKCKRMHLKFINEETSFYSGETCTSIKKTLNISSIIKMPSKKKKFMTKDQKLAAAILENAPYSSSKKKIKKVAVLYKYRLNSTYKCKGCNKLLNGKHFARHLDECKKLDLPKDFCDKCNRTCLFDFEVENEDKIIYYHKHKCWRPIKTRNILKRIKISSIERKKRRWAGEKKIGRSMKTYCNFSDTIVGVMYLRAIVSDFTNRRRDQIISIISDLKVGYPLDYIVACMDWNSYSYNFWQTFHMFIGKYGRFYGDSGIQKDLFSKINESMAKLEHSNTIDKIRGLKEEDEQERAERFRKGEENAANFLKNFKIPKFEEPKISDNFEFTYLLACAARRRKDLELKSMDPNNLWLNLPKDFGSLTLIKK